MLTSDKRLFIAAAPQKDGTMKELCLDPRMANRHGLITGATGTGKTVTLQNMAESFSALGVPVFLTDIKGDLSGLALPGGYDEPAGGLGDLPRRIDLHGEGLRRDGVVEEVHPAIGNARNFQSRRDGRCRSVVGVVVAARSGQQGCSTGEYP